MENNKILLESGLACDYQKGSCTDIENGYTTWDIVTDRKCEDLKYDVLYSGKADKAVVFNPVTSSTQTIYSVNQDDMVFAITIIKPVSICLARGFQTEHTKIVILPKKDIDYSFHIAPVSPRNIDLFAYVNSKFVYTERHIRGQMYTM